MDKIFIKERINILDYRNNNQDLVYSSQQDVEGGLLNVQLESDVAGWHQLSFDVPAYIIQDGKQIANPLMKNLFPLARLQYTRTTKFGDDTEELILRFVIQPEIGQRDDNGIVIYSYQAIDHPRHYLSKSKNGITIGENTLDAVRSLTPENNVLDVPGRVIYVKAPVQELQAVMLEVQLLDQIDALPGAFIYVNETDSYYRLIAPDYDATDEMGKVKNWLKLRDQETYKRVVDSVTGTTKIVPDAIWNPEWMAYPLAPDVNSYNYGTNEPSKVQFYWDLWFYEPAKTMGRFEGVMYRIDDRLLYDVYQTISYETPEKFLGTIFKSDNLRYAENPYEEGATAYVLETGTVWIYQSGIWQDKYETKRQAFNAQEIYKGTWQKLEKVKPYLAPNVPKAYLDYILEGTDWKVGEVDEVKIPDGKIEKDPNDSTVNAVLVDKTMSVFFDNSNAYNALGEVAQAFEMYLRFDHVKKLVHLKAVPGEDNDLLFQWRDNLRNSKVVNDGEKVVSKLWVYGGEDLIGEVTIADYERIEPFKYKGAYVDLAELKSVYPGPDKLEKDDYARLVAEYTWQQLVSQTYKNGQRLPITGTFVAGELTPTSWGTGEIPIIQSIKDLPATGSLGQAVYILDMDSIWAWIPEGGWYDTFATIEPSDNKTIVKLETLAVWTGTQWITKGQYYEYYEPISPYGDNYILDFTYFVDRGLLKAEEVEDIKYNYVLPISKLNRKRWPLQKQLMMFQRELLDRNSQYDAAKISRDAIDKSLRTSYAIYDRSVSPNRLIELEINAYPPGATYGIIGWTPVPIVYTDINVQEYPTYAALKAAHPSGVLGETYKVASETQVYRWLSPYSYKDTITSYLNWDKNAVDSYADPAAGKIKQLLRTQDDLTEARVRTVGLFQKYRDEELWGRAALNNRWYNPPANPNEIPATESVGDAKLSDTSIGRSYYAALNRKVDMQLEMDDCLDRIANLQTSISETEQKIRLLQEQIDGLEHGMRIKYGDFIVEGVYTNQDMVYVYNLWLEGIKALQLYHYPLVTYELGVVDVSGLPEYRTMTEEVYHDIVYRMNKPELVLPSPGDYVYITDNTLDLVRVQAHVTAVTRSLSNPSQHQITIATVNSNTEELIGRLVTAANTIFDKQHIYNRSAIIKADGTLATDSVKGTIDDPDADIAVLCRNGTVRLEGNGILTVDKTDPYQRMQYTGKGIYASVDAGVTWENIISAGKIQIKSLSAGNIDSNVISVSNLNRDGAIVIDGKGIAGYNYTGTSAPNNPAAPGDPKCSFFINAVNGNAYFKGHINAGSGTIGGWNISQSNLSSGAGSNFTGMSSTSSDYRFVAGGESYNAAKFAVSPAGILKATGATIEGHITATSGTFKGRIEADSGFIGNWTINSGAISNGNTQLTAAGNLIANGVTINSGTIAGTLTTGNLTATGGRIGGWTISGNTLSSGGTTLNGGAGSITTSNITVTGGSINFANKFRVSASYGPELTNASGGFITMGAGVHGWHSGVNVNGSAGVNFRSGTAVGSSGNEQAAINYPGYLRISSQGNINIDPGISGGDYGVAVGGSSFRIQGAIRVGTSGSYSTGVSGSFRYQKSLTDARILEFKNGILISERGN